jgi:hypothetical protein
MTHNFQDKVAIYHELSITEVKELLKLAIDCEVSVNGEIINKLVNPQFPYYCWDGDKITQMSCIPKEESKYRWITLTEFTQYMKGKGKEQFKKELTLNSNYKATITKDNITVGCQTFTHETLDKLYELSLKARNS